MVRRKRAAKPKKRDVELRRKLAEEQRKKCSGRGRRAGRSRLSGIAWKRS